jgi:hypothetical protein
MQSYVRVSGIVFALITLLHLVRSLAGFPVRAGGLEIPSWPSWLAILLFGSLCVWAFRLLRGAQGST